MQWWQILLEYLKVLAWPVVVIVLVMIFRAQIENLISRIQEIGHGQTRVLVRDAVEQAQRAETRAEVAEAKAETSAARVDAVAARVDSFVNRTGEGHLTMGGVTLGGTPPPTPPTGGARGSVELGGTPQVAP